MLPLLRSPLFSVCGFKRFEDIAAFNIFGNVFNAHPGQAIGYRISPIIVPSYSEQFEPLVSAMPSSQA